MEKADLDWKNLSFGFLKTDFNIRYTWKNGQWNQGMLTQDDRVSMHMAATCLHYGQECFEGLKVFEQKNGDITAFRIEENAKRMVRSCEKIYMAPFPEHMFIEAVEKVVDANRRFVPPYGNGAALYVRPFMFGTGPQVGVKPADEYEFIVFVTPVGPYFKSGFKPVSLIVEEAYDRAAPNGVGDVKVGGNYAAGLRASFKAKEQGYTEVLYLDAKEKRYIDESGPANFFGVMEDGQYVTPKSDSILPSITNMSLVELAEEMGMRPERRAIEVEEIFGFVEAGCCGTAAVITPVGDITYRDRKVVYSKDGEPGEYSKALYEKLVAIQLGEESDTRGWNRKV